MEEVIAGARKRAATDAPRARAPRRRPLAGQFPRSPANIRISRLRDERGKFLPSFVGVERPGVPGRVQVSERRRVGAIRAKRRIVLNALREAKARRLRDGTIKRLKAESRNYLNQIRLTRGL